MDSNIEHEGASLVRPAFTRVRTSDFAAAANWLLTATAPCAVSLSSHRSGAEFTSWGWEASAECALVRLACAVAIGPLSLSSGHSRPLAQICGSTHALPPSALPHYNHLADSNDDTVGSLLLMNSTLSTILNQLHTASSILLDDRCSALLFDLHAPSLPRVAAVALDFRECPAQICALVCVC